MGFYSGFKGLNCATDHAWLLKFLHKRFTNLERHNSYRKSNKMQQCIKLYYSKFIWSSTCFGRHTAYHQEPKTALAVSGFAYVEGFKHLVAGSCYFTPFTKLEGHNSYRKSNKMQQCIKIYYSIFIWSSTCFGRHTAHHQEPKIALAASGFAYVEDCWTCGCWTLSFYAFYETRRT